MQSLSVTQEMLLLEHKGMKLLEHKGISLWKTSQGKQNKSKQNKQTKSINITLEVNRSLPCHEKNYTLPAQETKESIAAERSHQFPQNILKNIHDITFLIEFLSS